MSNTIAKWIGSNGDLLIPLSTTTYNTGNMVSTKTGEYYMPIMKPDVVPIVSGNPIGLLLSLTYTV